MSNTPNIPKKPKGDDTDLNDFFESLAGGVQAQIMAKVLSSVSKGVLDHGTKGKTGVVTLNLKIQRLSDDTIEQGAVKIISELSFGAPTLRGKKVENEVRESVMYMTPTGLSDVPARKLSEEELHQQGMPSNLPTNYAN